MKLIKLPIFSGLLLIGINLFGMNESGNSDEKQRMLENFDKAIEVARKINLAYAAIAKREREKPVLEDLNDRDEIAARVKRITENLENECIALNAREKILIEELGSKNAFILRAMVKQCRKESKATNILQILEEQSYEIIQCLQKMRNDFAEDKLDNLDALSPWKMTKLACQEMVDDYERKDK